MKKNILSLILGIFIILSVFPLVNAQPPFESIDPPSGLAIEVPVIEPHELNTDFDFHVHVHNASTGYPLYSSNGDEECFIHLYNTTGGSHIVEAEMEVCPDNGIDYEYEVTGGNFSIPGQYAVVIWCNNSFQGDFLEFPFYVQTEEEIQANNSGLTTPHSILYLIFFLILGAGLFFSINGVKKAVNGSWMIAYTCLTYILLYLTVAFLWILSMNYLQAIPLFESIFYIIWFVMGVGFLPFVIIVSLVILGKEAKAALEQGYVDQGYSRQEAKELSRKKR